MNPSKTIKIILLLLFIQIAAKAQVTYTYDASGNRTHRTITPIPMAPPQNTVNDTTLTVNAVVNSMIAADTSFNNGKPTTNANNIAVLTEGDIKVFPNPVQEKLNVQFNGTATTEGCSLQLYDGLGRLFYSQDALQNLTVVNMQQAKVGNYYLVVICKEGKRLYWKLLKN